ncbi:glycoside hydrolase family 15 protein [Microvirga alba]|uniref:glucan 1,4-alpha-glucosidase n=1 Tax=Microvirga alba TaxID=2791025 RepID=A0A931FPA7_9HYPH|nr:glycoside hydrolase family 15 protein [Microvirga alba]MBF9234545.1 glycoside hydrolase family 15 protein [Microvirga alba]
MGNADQSLIEWMEAEMRFASAAILQSVSATDLVMNRASFGQRIVPKPGSIVAAPATDLSGGDPDYFFHWLRDSSLVMDALRILHQRGRLDDAPRLFGDFVAFSLGLRRLDGPALLKKGDIRQGVEPGLLKYVRPDDELMSVLGDKLLGEVRFNPDGALDIIKWSRPQNDGPALRALSVLRYASFGTQGQAANDLACGDLAFVERHWSEPCYDLWEEEFGHHYYTRLVQMAALEDGAQWMSEEGDNDGAGRFRAAAHALRESLDLHWSPTQRFYRSHIGGTDNPQKDLDASVILAVLHADRAGGAHSVLDPRVHATLEKLEDLFIAEYRINNALRPGRGPAMGRYAGDHYVSGGAWYITTLAVAEFYYRLAGCLARGHGLACNDDNASFLARILDGRMSLPNEALTVLLERGDAFMATVRDYAPASGELSEQFDQSTGEPTSAKNLAWSYAAFITAYDARQHAIKI